MSEPTIPYSDDATIPCAVLLYNLRNSDTPADAEIERLAQEAVKFVVRRAEKRKLSVSDAICVGQEVLARLLVAPVLSGAVDRTTTEKLIADMMGIATRRALDMLDGHAPGQGSVAEKGN